MSFQLVIAEKPSVARSIAAVIGATEKQNGYWQGGGYLVSWCIGHLVSFAEAGQYDEKYCKWKYEDLPILPQLWKFIVPDEKKQQFEIVRSLLNRPDVDSVTAATDAGREGELIFRFVYQMAGCTKPVKRLWISSMEDAAIREGFANLRPDSDYDALYQSALCRAKADWLVGINATRLFSVLYHKSNYAKATEQISVYEADMTYSELFEGQKVKFWPIDEKVPDSKVSVISISDLNRALAMQNKAPITLNDGQYLLNCNYNGTYRYIAAALQSHPEITVGGVTLQRAEDKVLQETYIMTSVGNNDRGTLIVPDSVTASLEKDVNALLVQYEPNADSNEILQKMIPIGLDSTHGYRYAEKNMMYETFYGLDALVSFLCCYIGLVFLLICAALLALKQLTETTDNVYRYGLLQKLGAGRRQIDHTLFVQTVVFFAIPLVVAGVYSAFLIGKAMAVVEEFMNIHIATNIGLTIVLFLLVYGSYFLATYLSCKRIVTEQRELEV